MDYQESISRAAALLELERRKKENPLYFFEPNEKLEPFVNATQQTAMVVGGNRSGKTETLVAVASACAAGYKPWVYRTLGRVLPEEPWQRPADCPEAALVTNIAGVRLPVPNRGLVVTGLKFKVGIGETVHPKFRRLLGPWIKRELIGQKGVVQEFETKSGSQIVYASDLQPGLAFESSNYDWYAIDEPISRRTFMGTRRGAVDRLARIYMAFTPLGRHAAWIFKDLYRPGIREANGKGAKISVSHIAMADNRWLPKGTAEAFESDPVLDELEKQSRLHGKFLHLIDRIYPTFDRDVHVVDPFSIPPTWQRGCVVDPHSVKPWAIAFFAVSGTGEIYFYNEWPSGDITKIRRDGRSIEEYAYQLRRLERDDNVLYRFMDPNYGPRSDRIRGVFVPSVQTELANYGLYFDCNINDDLEYGESRLRALLNYDKSRKIDALNRPKLYIFSSCSNLIDALDFYAPAQGESNELNYKKRTEEYKHFADLLRYVAVSEVASNVAFEAPWLGSEADDLVGAYGEPL